MTTKSLACFLLGFCFATATHSQCFYSQVDRFDRAWIINGESVICIDKNSKLVGEYSNIQLGRPTSLDVTNPLKVLVFFQPTQVLVFLDNSVSQISEPIYLTKKNIADAGMVCRSSKGGIWVYDRLNREVILLDANANPTTFKIYINDEYSSNKPFYMQEQSETLFVGFSNKEIIKYNEYGQLLGSIPVSTKVPFLVSDTSLLYSLNNQIYKYSFNTGKSIQVNCDGCSGCIPVTINNNLFYFNGIRLISCK